MTLPPPDTHCWDEDTSKDVWSHSAHQMRAYAEQAVAQETERLRRAMHDIAEEWAGAECGEPVTAQEAYAIELAHRMYRLAVEGMTP